MGSKLAQVTSDLQTFLDPGSGKRPLRMWFADPRRQRTVFWTVVVVLGLLQAWSHRLLIDHDGVAYLDIAENYARGAWSAAINAYYSPLYSWLLALTLLPKFPRSWESTLLHFVNFAGYLAAYACFQFFLRQLFRSQKAEVYSAGQAMALSESAWQTLGLGVFLYSTLFMANISGQSGQGDPGSTPDIFVVLIVFLVAGLLLRMRSGEAGIGTYSGFGAALGFGYLAKTVMFPLSFVFLMVAALASLRQPKRTLAFFLAPACFALVAGAWIITISRAKGEFTYGDAGSLTYRWLVGPEAHTPEWGGQTQEEENLLHPPHRLSLNPPVYEFATPVAGTFPLWYGNSYWLAGWKFHFSRVGQMRILHESYNTYRWILDGQKEYLVLLFFLILAEGALLQYFKAFLKEWVLWLPAIAALGLYALVRVEGRYVAPFVAMLWISAFAAVKLSPRRIGQQLALWAVIATVLTTGVAILHGGFADFHTVLRNAPSEQEEVATGLRKLGVAGGQSLATIGIPRDSFYWARLAGVRVISEIPTPNANQYWFASPSSQEIVRSLFAKTGAVGIVTDLMPAAVSFPESSLPVGITGWQRIGNTSYFFFPLRTRTSAKAVAVDSKVVFDR